MDYLLLLCATLTCAVKGLVCKKIGGGTKGNRRVFELNALIFLGAALTVGAYAWSSGIGFVLSQTTFFLAMCFAFMLMFTQLTETFAMRYGPASITSLIYSLGFLFPIFYSTLFLKEHISVLQICGMMVAVASLCFMIDLKHDRKMGGRWLLLSFLACFGSGVNAIIQKIHRSQTLEQEVPTFLVMALLLAAVLSYLIAVVLKRVGNKSADLPSNGISLSTILFNLLFCGVSVGALNILNLVLAGRLPAIIQFPVYNIGSMILVGLGGKFIFKDQMTRKQIVGFGIGCVAILMIGLL